MQLLRSDSKSEKVRRIDQIMNLGEADARTFWPTYRECERELGKLAPKGAEFIADFIRYHEDNVASVAFTSERARGLSARWFRAQRLRLGLLEQYHDEIEKALSPLHAAQFAQIEHRIALFLDVTVSAEMPIIGRQQSTSSASGRFNPARRRLIFHERRQHPAPLGFVDVDRHPFDDRPAAPAGFLPANSPISGALQARPSMESRARLQAQTSLDKTWCRHAPAEVGIIDGQWKNERIKDDSFSTRRE